MHLLTRLLLRDTYIRVGRVLGRKLSQCLWFPHQVSHWESPVKGASEEGFISVEHRKGALIRDQHQHSADGDGERKRQYEWQHSARRAPPHRLSAATNPHEPERQIALLTPMDKHIWQPGSTGVHCDSSNQRPDIHRSDFPFSHCRAGDGRQSK